jgi:hypothetical protein
MANKPTRRELEAIAFMADRDLRTVKRYFSGLPVRPRTRDSLEAAIASVESANLLAEPLHDPDGEGLSQ